MVFEEKSYLKSNKPFKIGDLVSYRGYVYAITSSKNDISISGFEHYTLVDANNDCLYHANCDHVKEASNKDIINCIDTLCGEEYNNTFTEYSVNFYGKVMQVGCKQVSLDDAYDMAQLILNNIGRE